jgi:hypothetical protein
MDPQILNFIFHDLVHFQLCTTDPSALAFFSSEFHQYAVESGHHPLPRLTLNFQRNDHPKGGLQGYSHYTHKVVARWNYRFKIEPDCIQIDAFGNKSSLSLIHHMLVHPGLRYLSAEQGVLLLHAGAVARDSKSLIFTGKGGAGKTTTTALVLDASSDWQVLADDYVFITQDRISLSYLTRSHLYLPIKKWVPNIVRRLRTEEKVRLEIFGRLRSWSREKIKLPVRIAPERLWPSNSIADRAVANAVLLLERGAISEPQMVPVTDVNAVAIELLEMNFDEARHFLKMVEKNLEGDCYSSWLQRWKSIERGLMSHILQTLPVYRLLLPYHIHDTAVFQTQLVALLNDLIGN